MDTVPHGRSSRAPAVDPLPGALPYGLQREMLLRAEFGTDGHPTGHRYPPVHELLLLRGPLDPGLLAHAVRQATEGVDVLRGRLRLCGGTVRWLPDLGRPTARLEEIEPGPPRQVIRDVLREAAEASFDLQHDPAARFLLARTGPDEHLLLIALDHACADGRTLVLLVRHLLHRYAVLAGEQVPAPARLPSFGTFAGQFGEALPGRAVSRAYWTTALARAEDVRRRPRFPGAADSGVVSFSTDAAAQRALDAEYVARLNSVAQGVGSDRHRLLLAAVQLVLNAWTDESEPRFVPFNYFRNGRHLREWLNVPGPLAEHAVTVPTEQEAGTLGDWLTGFVRANAGAPPFHGLSLRELETPASEHNRIAVFNFLPPLGRPAAAGLRILPCPPELAAEMEPDDQSARFPLRVRLVQDMDAPLIFRIEHDPRVLPDGAPFLDAALGVVESAAVRPGLPLGEAYRRIRHHWT
ncbi:condensation domain-containing protein [Streptomyces sp. NPDC020681]|uniref:condensation domain-containing protein n=1 Tax=Streptomyces sp. NPDC020681 TaxID=3365083 RepID=UPI0037A3BDB3